MEDPADGDGAVNIFPVLAQSRPGADGGLARPFTGCRLAPSVTYIYQTKAHWYYTEPKDLSLSTKLKRDLSNRNIIEGFAKDDLMLRGEHTPKSEIIAVYIRSFRDPEKKDGSIVTMFDYMDIPTLRTFLYAPPHAKQNNGILQRWVDSKGENNTVLRVTWTPRHAEVERRQSRRPLEKGFVKKLAQLYRRVATFEGPEALSVVSPMSGEFPRSAMIEAAEAIVGHLQSAGRTAAKVARIQLYFKIDSKDRVWLMWCSSLRLFHELPSMVVQVSPLVDISLRLGVPLYERNTQYLGGLAVAPGGNEGEEIEDEHEFLAFKTEQEKVADERKKELELTVMRMSGTSGRHFPVQNVVSGWDQRHDISQVTSPMPMAMALSATGSRGRSGSPALTVSPQHSEEIARPLLEPVEDFHIGGIYRRQSRDGVKGPRDGGVQARRRREKRRMDQLSLTSSSWTSSTRGSSRGGQAAPAPARQAQDGLGGVGSQVSHSRSLGDEDMAQGFRHTDMFREMSLANGRLALPPAFQQVYRRNRQFV